MILDSHSRYRPCIYAKRPEVRRGEGKGREGKGGEKGKESRKKVVDARRRESSPLTPGGVRQEMLKVKDSIASNCAPSMCSAREITLFHSRSKARMSYLVQANVASQKQ